MAVYKLEEYELTSGYWYNAGIDVDPGGTVYVPTFIPDKMIIYIATSSGTIVWDDVVTDAEGYIKNTGSIREGFDYRKGTFTYDDLEIEAFNVSGFWSDYVFNDSIKNIEIRIVYSRYNGVELLTYTPEPVFSGKILLDDYEVKDNDDPTSIYYNTTQVYKFRAFGILKVLEEKTITDLRTAIAGDANTTKYNHTKAYMKTYGGTDFEWLFQKDYYISETESWDFVSIKNVIKNIFELTGLTVVTPFAFSSDFKFWQKGYTYTTGYLVSDLLIPFRVKLDGAEPTDKGYYWKKMFDDDTATAYKDGTARPESDKTDWSFYHLNNVMELLCSIFHSFGMIWHLEYQIPDEDYPHLFNLKVSCNQRSSSQGTITIENLKEATKKISAAEIINGYKVTVPEAGDYMVGTKDDVKLNCFFMLQSGDWNDDKKYSELGTQWEHSLYFLDDSLDLRFVDSVSYDIDGTTYNYYTVNSDLNITFSMAICNYYANSAHGIWKLPKKTYEITFLATKATLGIYTGYQYLKPNYSYTYAGDTCIITKTDKDNFKNSTKIEMVQY